MRIIKQMMAAILGANIMLGGAAVSGLGAAARPIQSDTVWETAQEYLLEPGADQVFTPIVPQDGLYELVVEYMTVPGYNITPQAVISLTGEGTAFTDKIVDFSRVWSFADGAVQNGRFAQDSAGNELIPSYVEQSVWQEKTISLAAGGLNLKTGSYQLTFSMRRESLRLRSVGLRFLSETPSYAAYYAKKSSGDTNSAARSSVKQEAELLSEKSHLEISVTYDRTSPAISPNSPTNIRYNLLGGAQFGIDGQWVNWEVDIPETGYYALDFIYRANQSNGLDVRRSLLIDGQSPFSECAELHFAATDRFAVKTLGDKQGNPYLFYLTKGNHSIRMAVELSGIQSQLDEISSILGELNRLYTKIMVVVGESPDVYRDYDLAENIDGLLQVLDDCAARLRKLAQKLDADGGQSAASLSEAARTLESMRAEPRKIPQRMDRFRSQINTVADLMGALQLQPMEIDYFVFRSPAEAAKQPKAELWDLLKYRLTGFIDSFIHDYSAVSEKSLNQPLNVWVSAADAAAGYGIGRDQAQIVSRLTADGFSAQSEIPVEISLLDTATLMSALVSGKGPDVALFVPSETISNLYYRNALVDLSKMTGFAEIKERFFASAFLPLSVKDKVYALPELQIFNMLFYRSDIFEENGLPLPDTWDEFLSVLTKLQKQGMQAGIPSSPQIYEMFLLQNGSALYDETVSATRMTETASVNAFTVWTDLYAKYGIPQAYDGLSRFRTGQMPLLLAPASFYGQLLLGAPEILGRWQMAPVPGLKTQDGINRRQPSTVSGAVILEKSKRQEEAFSFLQWWTSGDSQARFASEAESKIGVSARYFPANRAAFQTLSWTAGERSVLLEQWEQVSGNPLSPANYFLTRNLNNAFRRVAINLENPRDVIYRYGQMVNDELARKRKELGLQ